MRLTPPWRSKERPADDGETETRTSFAKLVIIVLLLAWAFRSLVFTPFSIPSGSMLPTLYIGDYVMVSKWPYGYSRYSFAFGIPSFDGRILSRTPERGDIVVFRAPGESGDFIKRVIGRPGDRIEVRGGMLVLNGRGIPREAQGFADVAISPNSPCRVVAGATAQRVANGTACRYPAYRETLPNGRSYLVIDQVDNPLTDSFAPVVVPDGHVFLMGDNRDDSLDSRFAPIEGGIGFVPMASLIGRASFLFWSTDGGASYVKPWTWFSALRGDRIGGIPDGEQ